MNCYLKKEGCCNYLKSYVQAASMESVKNTNKFLVVELEVEKNTLGKPLSCWDINTNASENWIFLFLFQLALDTMWRKQRDMLMKLRMYWSGGWIFKQPRWHKPRKDDPVQLEWWCNFDISFTAMIPYITYSQ